MFSLSTTTTPSTFSLRCFFDQHYFLNAQNVKLKFPRRNIRPKFECKSGSSDLFVVSPCSTKPRTPSDTTYKQGVSDKVKLLVSEFKSLTEPIDRVKGLLHYAAMLAPFDESARLPENRVKGCATQVWLDVRMDKNGKVWFRADSDSEISKGFCSCLIWVMDGADPEEVIGVTAEELAELNVGVHGKVQSRVNTWQNVLTSMQDRTAALVAEKHLKLAHQLRRPPFSSLSVNSDGI
ncbi:SufE-like protein 2 [Hibiscus syriacus]|uniref:SufE-like protein 2 n=1 Tax=Hibiscus syriacus TaxID=106335 RepID=A0A6A2WA70_HIBSY|nr:sufE-like protein 2, chloroplastic [Hibiscus syriacus]KAE8653751.1 SufE-like protein 2 [Hibiscus syriacus]